MKINYVQFALGVILLAAAVYSIRFLVTFQSEAELVEAVAQGDTALVSTMLDQGRDIDGFGKDSWTPLTMAVEKDDLQMVVFLLDQGADPNRSVPGGTALDMALRRQRPGPTKALLKAGGKCSEVCDLLKIYLKTEKHVN